MDLDLDGFGVNLAVVDDHSRRKDTTAAKLNVQSALRHIDNSWYGERNRRGRQMDLIGDYAGTEPFVLDGNDHLPSVAQGRLTVGSVGEALLQEVLDDPLLAIARPSGKAHIDPQP